MTPTQVRRSEPLILLTIYVGVFLLEILSVWLMKARFFLFSTMSLEKDGNVYSQAITVFAINAVLLTQEYAIPILMSHSSSNHKFNFFFSSGWLLSGRPGKIQRQRLFRKLSLKRIIKNLKIINKEAVSARRNLLALTLLWPLPNQTNKHYKTVTVSQILLLPFTFLKIRFLEHKYVINCTSCSVNRKFTSFAQDNRVCMTG